MAFHKVLFTGENYFPLFYKQTTKQPTKPRYFWVNYTHLCIVSTHITTPLNVCRSLQLDLLNQRKRNKLYPAGVFKDA